MSKYNKSLEDLQVNDRQLSGFQSIKSKHLAIADTPVTQTNKPDAGITLARAKEESREKAKVTKQPKSQTDKQPGKEEQESSGKRTKRQQVEDFLREKYKFKYNKVTGAVEWSWKAERNFTELNDRQLSTFCREIDRKRGLEIDSAKLKKWLESDFVPAYHPLREYFDSLATSIQLPSSPIDTLIGTVKTTNDELFAISLRRWLVASVANVFSDEGCQNQTCLVLTGEQGAYKTTWLNLLIPPSLIKYLFCGRIELGNKDTYSLLATQLIINLDDQLRELNKRDAETVKTLISHGNVTVRLPYQMLVSRLSRMASFVASINGADFLSDPTGSRRFLPFEVTSIDLVPAKCINMDSVWAEAYRLFRAGFQYWFTTEETKNLFANNDSFQVHTSEYELLIEHFEPVDPENINAQYMNTTQIHAILQAHTKLPLTIKQVGAALTKMGFRKTSVRHGENTSKRYIVKTLTLPHPT